MPAENVYDEPSLPDPIYQEITVKNVSEIRLELTGNLSYVSSTAVATDSKITLNKSPAYEIINAD